MSRYNGSYSDSSVGCRDKVDGRIDATEKTNCPSICSVRCRENMFLEKHWVDRKKKLNGTVSARIRIDQNSCFVIRLVRERRISRFL